MFFFGLVSALQKVEEREAEQRPSSESSSAASPAVQSVSASASASGLDAPVATPSASESASQPTSSMAASPEIKTIPFCDFVKESEPASVIENGLIQCTSQLTSADSGGQSNPVPMSTLRSGSPDGNVDVSGSLNGIDDLPDETGETSGIEVSAEPRPAPSAAPSLNMRNEPNGGSEEMMMAVDNEESFQDSISENDTTIEPVRQEQSRRRFTTVVVAALGVVGTVSMIFVRLRFRGRRA